MSEMKHTAYDLAQMQSLPLEAKITMTKRRIREWYEHWDGNVYVSFSGGKDSTVLLHIVREMYPDVPAVFVDTGLEFPEIKAFVKSFDNVTILRPKMSFRQVIERYGYPLVSKKTARGIRDVRRNKNGAKNDNVAHLRLTGYTKDGRYAPSYKLPDKWLKLIDAPFKVSEECCSIMKKAPMNAYCKKTHRKPMTAVMAAESEMRKETWMMYGCNMFEAAHPISNPMSFWAKQDVLQYLYLNKIQIATVYGDIVIKRDDAGRLTGIWDTTGEKRTGCIFCMFGAHLEKSPNRFERLKKTHPQLWEYCMKPWDKGGLGLKEVCDYVGIKTGEGGE